MKRFIVILSLTVLCGLAAAMPALAHEHRDVGGWSTDVGWIEEPSIAGFKNGVHFGITLPAEKAGSHDHADDSGGTAAKPVTNARLTVEVIFGNKDGAQKTAPMPLEPSFGEPGVYTAPLVPTRAGTYTFHIKGTIGKTAFDEFYTSSEKTFASVETSSDLEFPERDATRQELAARLTAADTKIEAATDGLPLTVAIAAIVLAAAALGVAFNAKRRA